jgi:hypothetical protein
MRQPEFLVQSEVLIHGAREVEVVAVMAAVAIAEGSESLTLTRLGDRRPSRRHVRTNNALKRRAEKLRRDALALWRALRGCKPAAAQP